ncbi:unnamed protein product [Phytomonas sp. EM1]|nr:unnamed protein product [Phytomonas sp. EM1]|eukprot:CCW62721.1 unnamed protein product [Phytomonas sp. isolate EM1]
MINTGTSFKDRFNQQQLRHIYSEYDTHAVSLALVIVSVLCIPFGVTIIVASDSIREVTFRYDNLNSYTYVEGPEGTYPVTFEFDGKKYSTGAIARLDFSLKKTMSAPIMVQYGLKNFNQNYLKYVKSLDHNQLQGGRNAIISSCNPLRYPGELRNESVDGYYSPCGAIAWSLFNDTISIYKTPKDLICDGGAFDERGTSLLESNKCIKKGVALRSEVKIRHNTPNNTNNAGPMWTAKGNKSSSNPFLRHGYYFGEAGHKIPWITDEDFVVWSNVAYLPDFYNNYRILKSDLKAGDYYFEIIEQYDVASFSGQKYVKLLSYNWLGQKQYILGIFLLFVGCILFVDSVAVLVSRYFIHK